MKNLSNLFSVLLVALLGVLMVTTWSCEDDEDDPLPVPVGYTYGDDVIDLSDTTWSFDKTHSSVRWETFYFLGSGALLTGRFNDFTVDKFVFVENDLSNFVLEGKVTLSTVNTGEPGRDAGCLLGTFDVATKDEASIRATSIKFDGSGGYVVTCELDFHGAVSEVTMQLDFTGLTNYDANSGVRGAPLNIGGLTGTFEFSAKNMHGIASDNIVDAVTVRVNAQFKQAL